MVRFEYKVIPAPKTGQKVRGSRQHEDKFAQSIQNILNELAGDGWEFQRSEMLPHEHRNGLSGRATTLRHLLVFRRPKVAVVSDEPEISAENETAAEPETADEMATLSADRSAPDRPNSRDRFFAGGKFLEKPPQRKTMKSLLSKHLSDSKSRA